MGTQNLSLDNYMMDNYMMDLSREKPMGTQKSFPSQLYDGSKPRRARDNDQKEMCN